MSIKSKPHKGTGFNELRFEDKKGSEEVFIHAEKDYRRLIKNNEIVKIEGELKVNVICASEKKAKSIQITANDFIEFNLGENQIKMTPTQITMAGKNVSIKGQAMTSIQGGMVKINADGGGASQAKASLEKMAVEAKAEEFDGFKGNETEKLSFVEKAKGVGAGITDFLVGDLVDGVGNAIDELKDGNIAGAVTEIAIGVAMTTPVGKAVKVAKKGKEAVLGKGKTDKTDDIIKEGKAENRALHEAQKNKLRQQMSKPHVNNPELQKTVNSLYRPNAKIGSGSTADAIRQERPLEVDSINKKGWILSNLLKNG